MSIIRQDYGNLADMATQQLLAPIFPTLVATKAVSKDGLFIINNTLYKATANIAQDAQIVVGTNAELASTVSEELMGQEDTWENVSFTHNSTYISNNKLTMKYNKRSGILFIGGYFTLSSTASANTTLFTLTGFKGARLENQYLFVGPSTGGNIGLLRLDINDNKLLANNSLSSATWITNNSIVLVAPTS